MGELSAGIDANSGNIIVLLGGNVVFGLGPRETLGFAAALLQLVAQHPQLQPKPEPQIVIAGSIPDFGGRLNGR